MIADIKNRLKELFEKIKLGNSGVASAGQEQLNNSVNGSFVHIMKFLEELENLITLTQNGKDIKQKLEKNFRSRRTKLNDQVKAFIEKKIKANHITKNDTKNKHPLNKERSKSLFETNPNGNEFEKSNLDLQKNAAKAERKKKHSSKNLALNISQSSEKKSDISKDLGEKVSQLKTDTPTQTSTNIGLSKGFKFRK